MYELHNEWNWRKVLMIGGLTSLAIEVLQMFGGLLY